MKKLNTNDLYLLVQSFFDYKCRKVEFNLEKKEITCILYDSFLFSCGFADRYETFGAGLYIGQGILVKLLGKSSSLNNDEDSIRKSLQIFDDYCRLRLPEKFLNAYDKAYKN
ncbi:MAG: hypothetical protein J1E62_07145 [Lachnospiraceae bacterium]|nr:hypothetical protein [Lachnospiraceae bacterium]